MYICMYVYTYVRLLTFMARGFWAKDGVRPPKEYNTLGKLLARL
jgi:hypothetical protein